MAKSLTTLLSFSAGEWSPTLTSRVDQAKYRSACKTLRNMVCLKTGPATRRPPTAFVAATKLAADPNKVARMESFVFSPSTTFMLEWGQNYVRFYSNGAQVNVTSAIPWAPSVDYFRNDYASYGGLIYRCFADVLGSVTAPQFDPTHWVQQTILELWTPYSADVSSFSGDQRLTEVFQLTLTPINDVIYVAQENHPRWALTRFSDELWTMKEVVELTPPLLDQNATDVTIAASAASGLTGLTATAPAWVTATYYETGDAVKDGAVLYVATAPHVSAATFLADFIAGKWKAFEVFQPGHVGSYWEIANLRASAFVEYDGTAAGGFAAGNSATITVYGDWEVRTYGVWSANIEVQGSADGGLTWRKLRVISGREDRNANISGKATAAMLMRIVVNTVAAPATPGATNPRVVLEAVDGFTHGIVKIVAFINPYNVTATTVTQLPVANAWVSGAGYFVGDRVGYNGVNYVCIVNVASATTPPSDNTHWTADGWPTTYWSEAAWSAFRGYPRAMAAFQQRVFCGFTRHEPLRVWGTRIGDIENWDLGDQSQADDGVAFDLDATGDGFGLWLAAQDALFAGFDLAEWVVGSSDGTGAIGPTSIAARRQSKWGSSAVVGAKVVGDALIFADRQGFALRQMLFSIATSKYMSQDLTVLSDSILNEGAVQMAYQRQGQKNGFLWVATLDGALVGMTYEMNQEVFGWHRHDSDSDAFESVAVLPAKGTNDDEVWVVVARTVNGVYPTRYVERMNPDNWQRAGDKNRAWFLDCAKTYANPSSNVFTGLGHLELRLVVLWIDGVSYGTGIVQGGQVTFDNYTPGGESLAAVGIPFISEVAPLALDSDERAGITKGLTKKLARIVIDLHQTLDASYRTEAGQGRLVFADPNNPFAPAALFTGVKDVRDLPGDYTIEPELIIFANSPLPLSVRSITIFYGIAGTP